MDPAVATAEAPASAPTDPAALLAQAPTGMRRRLLAGLAGLAVVQAVAWPLALASGGSAGLSRPGLAWGAFLVATVALTVGHAMAWLDPRRLGGGLSTVLASATVLSLVAGGLATAPGAGTAYSHPVLPVAIGVCLLLALTRPRRQWWAWLGAAGVAYLVGITATLQLGTPVLSSLAGNLATLVGLPALVGWLAAPWLQAGRDRQSARAELHRARAGLEAAGGRERERTEQYRLVHDTVLSSLSALSRGSLDPARPEVRQRLAAEADYLRGLIATSESAAGMYLVGELARATREHAAAGLRVHPHIDSVPDVVPREVVRAMGDALREALANVVKHAGHPEAWVTIVGAPPPTGEAGQPGGPALSVTVTDRGAGFEPGRRTAGLGLEHSIGRRLADVGGAAVVDSEPGQGTSVELRWPA